MSVFYDLARQVGEESHGIITADNGSISTPDCLADAIGRLTTHTYTSSMGQIVYRRFRREQPELWRTVSGWMWMLYATGVVASALWLTWPV